MANDYAYLDATVEEIELNPNKITQIDDDVEYTDEQYPSVEAVKNYVNEHGASITVDDELSETSTNPVQNKVISIQLHEWARILNAIIDETEYKNNKTTEINESSTDVQYPSAKAVYTLINAINALLNGKLDLTGGIMTGNIQLTDGARLQVQGTANNPAITMASRRIGALGDPSTDYDAANKRYVDNAIAAALIVDTEEVIP